MVYPPVITPCNGKSSENLSFIVDVHTKSSIYGEFQIAIFDSWRVYNLFLIKWEFSSSSWS
jgi:hypothetical protein